MSETVPLRQVVLVLSGGAGTRLWPVSHSTRPKTIVPRLGGSGETLLEATLRRAVALARPEDRYLITMEDQAEQLVALTQAGLLDLHGFTVIVEPTRRNTAPCIALALVEIRARMLAAGDTETEADAALLTVLPADHHIGQQDSWNGALHFAASLADSRGQVVCLGIRPDRPSSDYGYIRREGPALQSPAPTPALACPVYQSPGFTEKPTREQAQTLIDAGALWNAGVFVARFNVLSGAYRRHAPDLWEPLASIAKIFGPNKSRSELGRLYSSMRDVSIDYAVMEHLGALTVVEVDPSWTDLGSWQALAEQLELGEQGVRQRSVGNANLVLDGLHDAVVWCEDAQLIALGLRNVVIAVHGARVLVADRDELHRLKPAVERLERQALQARDKPSQGEHELRSKR